MTELEKMREWLATFDGMPQSSDFQIDYNRNDPTNAGLHSNGLTEISREADVLGNWTVTNQLNFALHVVLPKPPDDDALSTQNAEWLLQFQKWAQRQSLLGKAPVFGNIDQNDEIIRAQNGTAYTNPDDGAALYVVTISVRYKEEIKEDE